MWFDRSELRGGNAWDSQIKKQIHDCALFVPLISAHTNARIEGYFRGEWNLATRRLVNRAHDAAFLMPVVIDQTREADARVPEEFFRAQWTWLAGGETPPAFAQRVRQLLGLDPGREPAAKAAVTGAFEPSAGKVRSVRRWFWFAGGHGKRRVRSVGLALVALVLVLAGGRSGTTRARAMRLLQSRYPPPRLLLWLLRQTRNRSRYCPSSTCPATGTNTSPTASARSCSTCWRSPGAQVSRAPRRSRSRARTRGCRDRQASQGRPCARRQRAQAGRSGAHHRAADRRRSDIASLVGDLRPQARGHLRNPG